MGFLTFVSLLILLLDSRDSNAIGDLFRSASSGFAAVLSCFVVYRQKLDGIFGRAYTSLTIGIACWFVAEIIWTYQEIGMGIENPFPSVADIFWLIGYAPLIYYIFKTYKLFASPKLSNIIVITLDLLVIRWICQNQINGIIRYLQSFFLHRAEFQVKF